MERSHISQKEDECPPLYWPDWADDLRCPDELFESAYQDMPDKYRVAIKTAIACAFFHFGQHGGRKSLCLSDEARGFCKNAQDDPAAFALVVFDKDFNAPARLVVPSVLAALCGVPLIGACCLSGIPSPQILLALELCGVEDLFCPDDKGLSRLLTAMVPGSGRIVLLGDCAFAHPEISLWREGRAPVLHVAEPAAFDLETIALAFGVPKAGLTAPCAHPDALFSVNNSQCARLVLGPGLEAFWLPDNLRPEFFRAQRLAFKMPLAE